MEKRPEKSTAKEYELLITNLPSYQNHLSTGTSQQAVVVCDHMESLTQDDIRNIIALINAAPIKGVEAGVVLTIQQKLFKMLDNTTPDGKDTTGEDR